MAGQQLPGKQSLAQPEQQTACIQTQIMAVVCAKVELNHPELDL
jgi:hypothetical protein